MVMNGKRKKEDFILMYLTIDAVHNSLVLGVVPSLTFLSLGVASTTSPSFCTGSVSRKHWPIV